jgi:hypothetical protein
MRRPDIYLPFRLSARLIMARPKTPRLTRTIAGTKLDQDDLPTEAAGACRP